MNTKVEHKSYRNSHGGWVAEASVQLGHSPRGVLRRFEIITARTASKEIVTYARVNEIVNGEKMHAVGEDYMHCLARKDAESGKRLEVERQQAEHVRNMEEHFHRARDFYRPKDAKVADEIMRRTANTNL